MLEDEVLRIIPATTNWILPLPLNNCSGGEVKSIPTLTFLFWLPDIRVSSVIMHRWFYFRYIHLPSYFAIYSYNKWFVINLVMLEKHSNMSRILRETDKNYHKKIVLDLLINFTDNWKMCQKWQYGPYRHYIDLDVGSARTLLRQDVKMKPIWTAMKII